MLFDRKKIQQALAARKALQEEVVEASEDGVRIKIRGDYKVLLVEVDGESDERLKKALNKVLKELLKVQASKLKGMMGDFDF